MTPLEKDEQKAPALEKYGDWLFAAAIGILVLLFLFKASFAGGSISRLCVLAEWDSVFDAWRTGHPQPYDPSLIQIFLPDYVFLAQNLCKGILPLWNPHCGLGYPFVGDIQSSVFSPLRLLFDFFPNLHTYNYYLIGELVIAAISSFFLALRLGSNRICALFAAICYTFCPYNLWYLELNLGSSASLFPLVTLAFVYAAQKRNLLSAILAGISSGLLILSGHPECSFFGIVLSSALMLALCLTDKRYAIGKNLLSFSILLFVAAITTVAVSAPGLFPFAEYLLNGESYKYGSSYSTPVSWNGIAFNLCNPGQNGASPFLGIIAAILLPLSLLGFRKDAHLKQTTVSLVVTTIITFALVSQFGPLQALFSKAPFTALITRYALPYQLLLLSLLAALGLEQLQRFCTCDSSTEAQDTTSTKTNNVAGKLIILGFALLVFPAILFYFSAAMSHDAAWMKAADFDAMLPSTEIRWSAWNRDMIFSGIFALIAFATFLIQQRKKPDTVAKKCNPTCILLLSALALGFTSLAIPGKSSLPLQSKFFYPKTELLEKIADKQYRCISTCEYVLRPATNSVYGINFLTVHNPLFPKRFLAFTKACGAQTDVFNQKFEQKLSTLLNLASVKYVLSLTDIEDAGGDTEHRFKLAYQSDNHIRVYENRNAAPRAYLVQDAKFVKSADEALAEIQSSSFDPSKTVILEEGTDANTSKTGSSLETIDANSSNKKQAAISNSQNQPGTDYEAVKSFDLPNSNSISIETDSPNEGWLVLTDIYYPGWNAYVDGAKAEIRRANFAFRAIKIESGKHTIKFAYEPKSFLLACAVFIFYVILMGYTLMSANWKRQF